MKYVDNCIFCKIGRHELPSAIVYEDAEILAFLDINPVSKGHTLIITKEHFRSFLDVPKSLVEKIFKVAQSITQAQINELEATGANILTNINPSAGQTVMHFHLHIIPRYDGKDGFQLNFTPLAIPSSTLPALAASIKEGL